MAVAGSMTLMTASTLMGASRLEYCDTTLEHREVVALLSRVSRSLSSTGWLMEVRISTPLSTAFWNDSEMVVGWMPGERRQKRLEGVEKLRVTGVVLTDQLSPSPGSNKVTEVNKDVCVCVCEQNH